MTDTKIMKTVVIIVLVSILIGFGIFFLYHKPESWEIKSPQNLTTKTSKKPIPTTTPTPTQTPTPLNSESNLKEETENLTPRDFSTDFNSLKESTN